MTRIRANCPTCGEVDLRPEDVTLCVVRDAAGELEETSTYEFSCPTCTDLVVKPADRRVAHLLTSGGVVVQESGPHRAGGYGRGDRAHGEDAGVRRSHPEAPPAGPPLTVDDVLDLHLLLTRPGWFDQLLALTWPLPSR